MASTKYAKVTGFVSVAWTKLSNRETLKMVGKNFLICLYAGSVMLHKLPVL